MVADQLKLSFPLRAPNVSKIKAQPHRPRRTARQSGQAKETVKPSSPPDAEISSRHVLGIRIGGR